MKRTQRTDLSIEREGRTWEEVYRERGKGELSFD